MGSRPLGWRHYLYSPAAAGEDKMTEERETAMFLRNYWYVAASDTEIGRKPLGRMILGEPVVFFRTEAGKAVAMEDRCAHRHLPLSMGNLFGGERTVHYPGL